MFGYFTGEPVARLFDGHPQAVALSQDQLLEGNLPRTEVLFLPDGYSVDEDTRPEDLNALLLGVCEVASPNLNSLPDGCFYYNGWPVPPQAKEKALEAAAPVETLDLLGNLLAKAEVRLVQAPATPGLVSARVIAMIVNEAHLLLQEGAASAEDIDLSMRLGTGYPLGPFAWEQLWGKHKTQTLLTAMAEREPEVVLPYWLQDQSR